jgi:predicted amidohydrolase YtcJ
MADLILHKGRLTTLDPGMPDATAIAIAEGKVLRTGGDR